MKKLIIIMLLFAGLQTIAQPEKQLPPSSVNSGGTKAIGGTYQINYTIGQPYIGARSTFPAGSYRITLGYQQALTKADTAKSKTNSEWLLFTSGVQVNSLACEPDYVWLATKSGLMYCDRKTKEIRKYYTCNSDIKSNSINDIAIDQQGNKWIATDLGLFKYNGSKWITVDFIKLFAVRSNVAYSVKVDANNNIWVGGAGVFKYDGTNWVKIRSDDAYEIAIANNDRFCLRNGNKMIISDKSVPHSFERTYDLSSTPVFDPVNVKAMTFDNNNNLWIGSTKNSQLELYKWDGTNWATPIPATTMLLSASDNVFDMNVDKNNKLLLATSSGIRKLDGNSWSKINIVNTSCIAIDESDSIWSCTNGFLSYSKIKIALSNSELYNNSISQLLFDNNDSLFAVFTNQNIDTISKFNGTVWRKIKIDLTKMGGVALDKDNNLWIGNENEILKYSATGTRIAYYQPENNPFGGKQVFFTHIKIDSKQNIWTVYRLTQSTNPLNYTYGLAKYDLTNWYYYPHTKKINDIEIDKNDGIWLATEDQGIAKFIGGADVWKYYTIAQSNEIYTLKFDSQNRLWVGLKGDIHLFDVITEKATPFLGKGNNTSAIYEGIYGMIWLGTSNGLWSFDGAYWKDYSKDNSGIPSNTIRAITSDKKNNIWIGTDQGIAVFNSVGVKMDIKGKVQKKADNQPVADGLVYLFNNTKMYGGYDTVATATIKPTGEYIFENQANCSFTIFAQPNIVKYPTLLPAYLGDTLIWMGADTLTVKTTSNANTIFCKNKPTNQQIGTSTINGTVNLDLDNFKSKKPCKNVGVVAKRKKAASRSGSEEIYYSRTDDFGKFNFANLPAGDYEVFIDYVGIPMFDIAHSAHVIQVPNNGNVTVNGVVDSAKVTLQKSSYTITASVQPALGGTVSGLGTGVFIPEQSVTLTATAKLGYTFLNWTENSVIVSTSASYTFSVTKDRLLVANFTTSNSPPIAKAGNDQSVNEGTFVTLDGSGSSDPNGDALSYTWTVKPTSITLSSTTASKPTFTAPEVASNTIYTFNLVVSDGKGGSSGDKVLITIISVQLPPWTVIGYSNSTEAYGIVTIDDIPAKQGDKVGAFVGNECRASEDVIINEGNAYIVLVIQGETSEAISFKIWQASTGTIFDVGLVAQSNVGGVIGAYPNYLPIAGYSSITQNLALKEEWNLISFNVHPFDPIVSTVMQPLSGKLVQLKNMTKIYNPSAQPFLNTLKSITDGEGYFIKLNQVTGFSITGKPIDVPFTTIKLKQNWNLIGYICQQPQAVEIALKSLKDAGVLLQVKNATKVYNPGALPFLNTLKTMEPGVGYWVNVTTPIDFKYSNPLTKGDIIIDSQDDFTIWKPKIAPYSTIAYGVVTLDGQSVPNNAKVGVFVGNECRSVADIIEYDGNSYVSLVINGEITEKLIFLLFDGKNIYQSPFSIMSNPQNTLDGFLPLEFTREMVNINTIVSESTKLSVYPNPFNDKVTICVDNNNVGEVILEIRNSFGQLVMVLFDGVLRVGNNVFEWKCINSTNSSCPPGIYFVRLHNEKHILTEKLVLIK